jgi:hypothetical protein
MSQSIHPVGEALSSGTALRRVYIMFLRLNKLYARTQNVICFRSDNIRRRKYLALNKNDKKKVKKWRQSSGSQPKT